jgi:hypothetical protein
VNGSIVRLRAMVTSPATPTTARCVSGIADRSGARAAAIVAGAERTRRSAPTTALWSAWILWLSAKIPAAVKRPKATPETDMITAMTRNAVLRVVDGALPSPARTAGSLPGLDMILPISGFRHVLR